MFESSFADADRAFDQGAHGIAQEHPIGGKMHRRFDAGGVKERIFKNDGSFQMEGQRRALIRRWHDAQGDEPVINLAHALRLEPVLKTVAGALGKDLHLVDLPDL